MKRKTNAYAFTITSLEDSKLSKIREDIKLHNKIERKFVDDNKYSKPSILRVCVKARLGKNNPNRALYKFDWGNSVKLEHGTRFDVYVQTRR
jgi:hypothetical protein